MRRSTSIYKMVGDSTTTARGGAAAGAAATARALLHVDQLVARVGARTRRRRLDLVERDVFRLV